MNISYKYSHGVMRRNGTKPLIKATWGKVRPHPHCCLLQTVAPRYQEECRHINTKKKLMLCSCVVRISKTIFKQVEL